MSARLTLERVGEASLTWELAATGTTSIGRLSVNTIVLKDDTVSRTHAQIFAEQGQWILRDAGSDTKNGTRVNERRIQGPTALHDQDEIALGKTLLKFTLATPEDVTLRGGKGKRPTMDSAANENGLNSELQRTVLHADELTVLLRFMNESLLETTPHDLIQRALTTVHQQTRATLAGFLSLDLVDPLPRLVVPAEGKVEPHLSQQLTKLALQTKRLVHLSGAGGMEAAAHSLIGMGDALCIPLLADRASEAQEALHVYSKERLFTDRDVQFAELLAHALANNLQKLREQRVRKADSGRFRPRPAASGQELIGQSAVMEKLRQEINRLADGPKIILINGESGVGKELVARALHNRSKRQKGPLVPVNCGAITATLAESALFGHEEHAFTGAVRHQGFFEEAEEGTLFLDEIGELTLDMQTRLLRVLDKPEIRRVGAKGQFPVNVRIVAATNRDLHKEVEKGRFREDLLYRLGIVLEVPPLRAHAEDIRELALCFVARFNCEYHRKLELSEAALRKLEGHRWPGNVRELAMVLENVVARSEPYAEAIHAGDFQFKGATETLKDVPPSLNIDELEAWAMRQALVRTNGNVQEAAILVGITRGTFFKKMKAYRIEGKNG